MLLKRLHANWRTSLRTAPGGILIQEGGENACQTETCLFGQAIDSMEMVKAWEQVFVRLVRR